jgi:hypothetical protein
LNDEHSRDIHRFLEIPVPDTASKTTLNSNATAGKPASAVETKRTAFKDIATRSGKFAEDDLSALKRKDDLVTQAVAKHGLEKTQIQRDVDALLRGRQI